ncbi:glycoside hydrolase family protein [Flammeovirgaceae bacterium 311]|nr:glycoside hydrolase family protein [Flammeovirgaceae bacterium 311]
MIIFKKALAMRKFNNMAVLCLIFLGMSGYSYAQKSSAGNGSVTNIKLSDGSGAYATKKYRNLFKEAGYSEDEINHKIEGAFLQLFHGDSASQSLYYSVGSNSDGAMAYILDVFHNDIRSEGMSYGMMISVQLDKKEEFDALWNYALSYMYISDPAHPSEGYFAWSLKRDGTPNSETPAPDGEEYFVMALYFASARWGDGEGRYNYKAWADKILTAMRHHPVKTGPTIKGNKTVGPMVNEKHKMILFVPQPHRDFTDPSYHLPHFYELWARQGPEGDRAFWAAAADTSRSFFHKTTHPKTGLAPDYAHYDGKPVVNHSNKNAKHFAYDSWRTAMNWSVDWAWWQKDPCQQELSNKIQSFFYSQGIESYGGIYTLEGEMINKGHPPGLVGTNATASLAATHPIAAEFVKALWKQAVPSGNIRYYEGLLYLMSLMHCSGNFRIYTPN